MDEIIFPYENVELTQEVNRLPNQYGLLNALGFAPFETKSSKFVRIELRNGIIHVLSAEPRGGPADVTPDDVDSGIIVEIPHFPHLETIKVADLDGRMEMIDGGMVPRDLDRELTRRLQRIRANHNITLEYIRIGALRGLIKDGKGRTLYDLYDAFGITKKQVTLDLSDETTDLRAKAEEVNDHIFENLKGETVTTPEWIVSPELFTKWISHPKFEKFWLQAQNSAEHRQLQRPMNGGQWGRAIDVFGVATMREYKGSLPVKNAAGEVVTERNIAANKGHAYPAGTQDMIRTYEAPAYHIDLVNEMPEEDMVFISRKELDHGEGWELKSQSNRLAVVKQPDCLVELIAG